MSLPSIIRASRCTLGVVGLVFATTVSPVHAAKPVAPKPESKPTAPVKHAPTLGSSLGSMGSGTSGFLKAAGIDLPDYVEPPAYSVDLVIHSSETADMVLKRFVDGGRIRTDISAQGQDISMIEMGDEKGTSYTVMPKQKMAIKQSREAMSEFSESVAKKQPQSKQETTPTPEANVKVEDLGDETLNGHAARKLRMSSKDGSALAWFDKATGAPLKMESTNDGKTSSIEWRDMKVGAQSPKIYDVPKGFEVTDMDEMMAKMKGMRASGGGALGGMAGMAGMGCMAGLPGMGNIPGMAGMGGGLNGMAGGMGANFGSQMGGQLGSTLGASLGGPLGAIAGHYIGGKIGGMIGRKAAQAIVPGN